MREMDKFIRIVQRYQRLHELGTQIIQHRKMVSRYPPSTYYVYTHQEEQDNRIQEFIKISEEVHQEWDENDASINKYWTGLS